MNFIDKVSISVAAGDGGDGTVSFRREKFVDHGGPDGGDGGDGGDVIFMASRNEDTLAAFRYQKDLKAENGQPGLKRRKHGKSGKDLNVKIPVGTVVSNEKGEVLTDLTSEGQRAVVAFGGKGGYGNAHFISSTRQAPKFAEKGEKGESLTLNLELKMIADVGLIGLPNAGKSSLLSKISHARPEIADYPFTTLTPNLGVVDLDSSSSLLFADIPGLIEGAAKGKGLGHEFLRHIERTKVLVHLIDFYQEDISAAYKTIQSELKSYSSDLSQRPQVVVLNKVEGLDEPDINKKINELKKVVPKNTEIFAISANSGQGIKQLLYSLKKVVNEPIKVKNASKDNKELPIIRLEDDSGAWHVIKNKGHFEVSGKKIDRFAARTDFSNEQAVSRLRDIMTKMGIMHELRRQGAETGQKVYLGKHGEITY